MYVFMYVCMYAFVSNSFSNMWARSIQTHAANVAVVKIQEAPKTNMTPWKADGAVECRATPCTISKLFTGKAASAADAAVVAGVTSAAGAAGASAVQVR